MNFDFSFQEALNSFRSKDTLVVVFEDYKLDISVNHATELQGLNDFLRNQTSKATDYFILLQKNEISNGEHVSSENM